MTARARLASTSAPDWLLDEMPPGYKTRALEIQRLEDDLRGMDRFARLLLGVGDELADAVHDTFVALGFEVERSADPAPAALSVKLAGGGRLLLHVAATEGTVQKKTAEVAGVFRVVHEIAEEGDRVVLVTNNDTDTRPADRQDPAEPEALNLLGRLGVIVLPGRAVFALWTLSLQDRARARAYVERLYEQDAGVFLVPAG